MSVKLIKNEKKVSTRLSPIRPQAEEFLNTSGYISPVIYQEEIHGDEVGELKLGKDNLFSF